METTFKKRRTWKRAPVKKPYNLIKENADQKIEKTIHDGKSALSITYKTSITLKNLTYIKSATHFLCQKTLPFSSLISFQHTKRGYKGIWTFKEGKIKPSWSVEEYRALGTFLGRMHLVARGYKESILYKSPIIL